MNVLVVDYIAPIGHVGYVSLQLKCIKDCGCDVSFYSHKAFVESCALEGITTYFFPKVLHCKTNNRFKPVLERIQGIIKILILRGHLIKHKYDAIVFTSYDIMSIWPFTNSTKTYLINHNNTTDFYSSLKKWIHLRLPQSFSYITLAPYIADYFKEHVNKPVIMIPHGLTKAYSISIKDPFKKHIYCPTTSSCNSDLFNSIANSELVNDYLQKNDLKLIVKSYSFKSKFDRVEVLSHYIDDKTYNMLMANALAVFAPYNDSSFKNRVSAVLMECLGSNIPIISSDNSSYSAYKEHINYDYIVNGPESFINCVESIKKIDNTNYYNNLDDLNPTKFWKEVLIEQSK